jgi:hypothetical protein
LSEEILADATRHLAKHIGPLAPVMVRNAAENAGDRNQLHALLAAQISDVAARSRFLAAVKRDRG